MPNDRRRSLVLPGHKTSQIGYLTHNATRDLVTIAIQPPNDGTGSPGEEEVSLRLDASSVARLVTWLSEGEVLPGAGEGAPTIPSLISQNAALKARLDEQDYPLTRTDSDGRVTTFVDPASGDSLLAVRAAAERLLSAPTLSDQATAVEALRHALDGSAQWQRKTVTADQGEFDFEVTGGGSRTITVRSEDSPRSFTAVYAGQSAWALSFHDVASATDFTRHAAFASEQELIDTAKQWIVHGSPLT